MVQEKVGALDISVWGSESLHFAVAFSRILADGTLLSFSALTENEFPSVVKDNEGNYWDVFGVALSGPRLGQRLIQPFSHIAYWFAWTAFHPEGEIYQGLH